MAADAKETARRDEQVAIDNGGGGGDAMERKKRWFDGSIKWDYDGYVDEKDGVFKRWSEHDPSHTPPPTPGYCGYGLDDEQEDSSYGGAWRVGSTFLDTSKGLRQAGLPPGKEQVRGGDTNTLHPHIHDSKMISEWSAAGVSSDHTIYEGLDETEQSRVSGRLKGLHIGARVAVHNESLEKAYQRAGMKFPDAIWRASPLGVGGSVGPNTAQEKSNETEKPATRDEDMADETPNSPKQESTQAVEAHLAAESNAAVATAKSRSACISSDDDLSDPPSNLNTPDYQLPSSYLPRATKDQDTLVTQPRTQSASPPAQDEGASMFDTKRKKAASTKPAAKRRISRRKSAVYVTEEDAATTKTLTTPAETLNPGSEASNSEYTTLAIHGKNNKPANGHREPMIATFAPAQPTTEEWQQPITEKDAADNTEMQDGMKPTDPVDHETTNVLEASDKAVEPAQVLKTPSTRGKRAKRGIARPVTKGSKKGKKTTKDTEEYIPPGRRSGKNRIT